jgi:hypothetical protein
MLIENERILIFNVYAIFTFSSCDKMTNYKNKYTLKLIN